MTSSVWASSISVGVNYKQYKFNGCSQKGKDIMEKTTVINIQGEASVNAKGKHVHGRSIPVVRIDTGDVFVSIIDAAQDADAHPQYMAARLRNDEVCTIKGKRYCYLSRLMESSDMVLTCLRDTNADNERRKAEEKRLEAKRKADEEDARKWREHCAEQERKRKEEEARIEAERKAKEKYEADVAKAKAKIKHWHEAMSSLEQKYNEAVARSMEAEMEYEALTGDVYCAEESVA